MNKSACHWWKVLALAALSAFISVHPRLNTPAHAQTAATGLLAPWRGKESADLDVWTRQQLGGTADTTGADVRLSRYHASAWWRLDPTPENAPYTLKLGASYDHAAIESTDPALPDRLIDASVALSKGFKLNDRWALTAVLGVGVAGDKPWAEANSLYGLADLALDYKLSDTGRLTVLLDYNGNRTVAPDIPIPGIVYTDRFDEHLVFSLGLPYSTATWTPDDYWTLHVGYALPVTVSGSVDYAFTEQLSAFARYHGAATGYHLDDGPAHRRVFLEQDLAELGLRYKLGKAAALTLAGGYAFNQKLTRGFDLRDTDTVREMSDEPYLRAQFSVGF